MPLESAVPQTSQIYVFHLIAFPYAQSVAWLRASVAHRRVYETRMPFGDFRRLDSIPYVQSVAWLYACPSSVAWLRASVAHRRVYETRMPFGDVRRLVKLTFIIKSYSEKFFIAPVPLIYDKIYVC
ncbi:4541_t:CDS:2 [Ambispora gerdemannii]|uniref:4541_t:CDS:1 n=1 Tax=Ambispora gerdemannii TaxID=144530 RepID=A0A9N9D748_9GLOM|nr:4541_t:CDS:2 [Ambispora gerdemannii]